MAKSVLDEWLWGKKWLRIAEKADRPYDKGTLGDFMSWPECEKCDLYGKENCPTHGKQHLKPHEPENKETAARAILNEQASGTPLLKAADRVFRMSPSELGRPADEETRQWRGPQGPFTPRGCF